MSDATRAAQVRTMTYDELSSDAPIDARSNETGLTVRELRAMLDRVHPENVDRPLALVLLTGSLDRFESASACEVLTRSGRVVFLQPKQPQSPVYIAMRFLATSEIALAVPDDIEPAHPPQEPRTAEETR